MTLMYRDPSDPLNRWVQGSAKTLSHGRTVWIDPCFVVMWSPSLFLLGDLCASGLCRGISVQWDICLIGVGCLWDIRLGVSFQGSLCPGWSLSRSSRSARIPVQGGSLSGVLCLVHLCPGGCLSTGVYVWGISVQGVCVWGITVLKISLLAISVCGCSGEFLSKESLSKESLSGGSLSGGISVQSGLCPKGYW